MRLGGLHALLDTPREIVFLPRKHGADVEAQPVIDDAADHRWISVPKSGGERVGTDLRVQLQGPGSQIDARKGPAADGTRGFHDLARDPDADQALPQVVRSRL